MLCRSLNIIGDSYCHFLYTLGTDSYHPPGAEEISENRLFGMYHANAPEHNREVIQVSMQDAHGTVHIASTTVTLGKGVNLVGVKALWSTHMYQRLFPREWTWWTNWIVGINQLCFGVVYLRNEAAAYRHSTVYCSKLRVTLNYS